MFSFTEEFDKCVDSSLVNEEFWNAQHLLLKSKNVSNSDLIKLKLAVMKKEIHLLDLYQIVKDINILIHKPLSMTAATIIAKYKKSKYVTFDHDYIDKLERYCNTTKAVALVRV